MNERRFVKALVAALAIGAVYSSGAIAATIVEPGTSESSVNKSIKVGEGTDVKDLGTVNGSIRLDKVVEGAIAGNTKDSALGAHDSNRDRRTDTKRAAHGHNPVTDP